MNKLVPVLASSSLLLIAACGDAKQSGKDSAEVNAAGAPQASSDDQQGLVTDFKSPELAGLAVRDHPQGVQVVTPPTARGTTPPPIGTNDLLWTLDRGAIFTSVNDKPARDARHFRELMDAVEPGKDLRLGQQLFLEDAGDGQVTIRTTPPDER